MLTLSEEMKPCLIRSSNADTSVNILRTPPETKYYIIAIFQSWSHARGLVGYDNLFLQLQKRHCLAEHIRIWILFRPAVPRGRGTVLDFSNTLSERLQYGLVLV